MLFLKTNLTDDKQSRRAQDSNYFRSVGMLPILFFFFRIKCLYQFEQGPLTLLQVSKLILIYF